MEKNVKVFFEDSGDYRRFLIRASTQQELFTQLRETIKSFWTEDGKTFDMLYRDEENDLIKLSSPQEFEVCTLCPSNREILRIFVKRTPGLNNNAAAGASSTPNNNVFPLNNNSSVWKQVTCDKCQTNPLQGIRYKCTVCTDYDECGNCFRLNPEHAHPMLALTDPKSEDWQHIWRRGSRHARLGGLGGGVGGPGGPLHHHVHHHGHGQGGPGGPGGEHRRGGGMRRCGGGFGGPGGGPGGFNPENCPPWLKYIQDAAQRFAQGQAAAAAGSADVAAAVGTQQHQEQSMSNVNFTTCEGGHPKVEVDVDMNDLLTRPESVFSTVTRAVEEVGKMFQSMAGPQQQQQQQMTSSVSSQTTKPVMEDKKEGTSSTATKTATDIDMQESIIEIPAPTVSTVTEEIKITTDKKNSSDLPAPPGWTLLNDNGGMVRSSSSSASVASAPAQPPPQTMMEGQINACIESLKELGFDTQKNWMRELVKQCSGDINRVMDELTPQANM